MEPCLLEVATAHPYIPGPDEQGGSNRSMSEQNDDEMLPVSAVTKETLLEALEIAAQLSAMDTAVYQSSMQKDCLATKDGDSVATSSAVLLQSRMDQIVHRQRKDSREYLAIERLTRSIHRFHANVTNLQSDVEKHTVTELTLRGSLEEMMQRNIKLSKTVKKLQKQNEKLKAKLTERDAERKTLVKHIRGFARQAKESEQEQMRLEQLNTQYKLQAHEHLLQQVSLRSRTGSADSSNLSEGTDPERLEFGNNNKSNWQQQSSTSNASYSSGSDDDGSFHSYTMSTQSSGSSLITDEGSPVLRLAKKDAAVETESDIGEKTSPEYSINFVRGIKIGICVRAISVDEFSQNKQKKRCKASKKIEGSQKGGILNKAIWEEDDDDETPTPKVAPKDEGKLRDEQGSFSFNFNFRNKQNVKQGENAGSPARLGFIVSGYLDFDEDRNPERPPIGARILAVDGERVEETWKLCDLMERLNAATTSQGNKNDGEFFTVTFRADPLSKRQWDKLSVPSLTNDGEATTGTRKNNPSAFNLKFLRLGNSNHLAPSAKTHKNDNQSKNDTNLAPETVEEEESKACEGDTCEYPHDGDTSSSKPSARKTLSLQFWKNHGNDQVNASAISSVDETAANSTEMDDETERTGDVRNVVECAPAAAETNSELIDFERTPKSKPKSKSTSDLSSTMGLAFWRNGSMRRLVAHENMASCEEEWTAPDNPNSKDAPELKVQANKEILENKNGLSAAHDGVDDGEPQEESVFKKGEENGENDVDGMTPKKEAGSFMKMGKFLTSPFR